MSGFHVARRLLFASSALLLISAAAEAEVRYVASSGSDARNCKTPATACRTLQRGINVTSAGGEVSVLDSGHYGSSATVNKSMTISGDNATLSGTRIIVASANLAVVNLRGLDLSGPGLGTEIDGVTVQSANAVVHIEDCVIHHFYNGILVTANARVWVTDSIARDNRASGLFVRSAPDSRLTVDGSRFENNSFAGLTIHGGAATITRSVLSGMSNSGGVGLSAVGASVNVTATTSAHNQYGYYLETSQMTFDSASAWGNTGYGLLVGGGSTARLSNSAFTNNGTGIAVLGGTVLTRGNNTVSGNAAKDVDGVLTPLGGV